MKYVVWGVLSGNLALFVHSTKAQQITYCAPGTVLGIWETKGKSRICPCKAYVVVGGTQ